VHAPGLSSQAIEFVVRRLPGAQPQKAPRRRKSTARPAAA
jgi:hypothetical protein